MSQSMVSEVAEDARLYELTNAEYMLVAGGMLSPQLVVEASRWVSPNDISDLKLRMLWSTMTALIDEGVTEDKIDMVSIIGKCAKGAVSHKKMSLFCSRLLDGLPKFTTLVGYAQAVKKRATMRLALDGMRSLATEIKEQLDAPGGDVEGLETRLARLSIDISSRADTTLRRTKYQDMSQEIEHYFDQLCAGPSPKAISTGLPSLDRRIGGGLMIGQLYSVLGMTGSGKTSLASQICDSAVQHGHRALMFSMEVDPIDVYIRDVERKAGRSRWSLRSHIVAKREAAQNAIVLAQAQLLGDTNGKIVYGEPISVEGIRQAILTERLRGGPISVVAVDHAQVALPSAKEKRNMPRYLEVKDTAEGLRAIARQLNVAIVLTAQLNPPPKGEEPRKEMVREGKDIILCSEVVLLIWHEAEVLEDGQKLITDSWLIVDKARTGIEGRVRVRYRGECFRWEEMASGHDEEES